jgi:hypothetical protein
MARKSMPFRTCFGISKGRDVVDYVELLAIGSDSGQAADVFKLLKMFVKGKGAFQFERPHDGEACAVGR